MIGRANPLARFGAAAALLTALLISTDVLTPALVLVVDLAWLPVSGVRPMRLFVRAAPLIAVAGLVGVSNGLVAAGGPSLDVGLALGLRVAAIALTGLLAVLPTEPTTLADALIQDTRVPPRLALSVLASMRLAGLVVTDWQTLLLARRARGIAAGRSPRRWLRLTAGGVLAVLTFALRRSIRLADALDARGLTDGPRSHARPIRMIVTDWLLVLAGVVAATAVVWLSLARGSWQFVLG